MRAVGTASGLRVIPWKWHRSQFYSKARIEEWKKTAMDLGLKGHELKAGLLLSAAIYFGTQDLQSLSDATAVSMFDLAPMIGRLNDNGLWKNGYWCMESSLEQMDYPKLSVWFVLWSGVAAGIFYCEDGCKFGLVISNGEFHSVDAGTVTEGTDR